MASSPVFAITPRIGIASVSVQNTNRDGTGTIVDAITGVAAGTEIQRVRLKATGDPADSIVKMYLYNGTSYVLFTEFDFGNPAAGSATVASYEDERRFDGLILPSASWRVAFDISATLTSGVVNCFVHAMDLT